ncbi:hypothetical protein N7526_007718 [Penicillium atrosanguineum]|nr:hypothetical protein N7526_007718 [Penicillium atrosanguineum]
MPSTATTFLDSPLLKVSRPVAACSRCRTAKIKCDAMSSPKERERSYVASLEGYCEKLEKKISQLRVRQTSLSAEGNGVAREMSITSTGSEGPLSTAHRREVSDIDDLVGDFGFLSVNATSRDFHGITSKTTFANLLLSVATVGYPPPAHTQSAACPARSNPVTADLL